MVDAADGRVVALSEELETLRQTRNGLERRRVELQLELAGGKLGRAFGVDHRDSGRGGVREGRVMAGVFSRWKLACLEAKSARMEEEADANSGKVESYEVRALWYLAFCW